MREILFRGKHLNTDEWYTGHLYEAKGRTFISRFLYDIVSTYVEVDPNTVGQYTGLKDKNGKMIFEGDKVKAKFFGKDVNGEIGFNGGCFLLWNSCVSDNQLFIFTDIEVIGTIHDKED